MGLKFWYSIILSSLLLSGSAVLAQDSGPGIQKSVTVYFAAWSPNNSQPISFSLIEGLDRGSWLTPVVVTVQVDPRARQSSVSAHFQRASGTVGLPMNLYGVEIWIAGHLVSHFDWDGEGELPGISVFPGSSVGPFSDRWRADPINNCGEKCRIEIRVESHL